MKGPIWGPCIGMVSHPEGTFGAPDLVFSLCHLREKVGGALGRCPAVFLIRPDSPNLLPARLRLGMGERGLLQGAGAPQCAMWVQGLALPGVC